MIGNMQQFDTETLTTTIAYGMHKASHKSAYVDEIVSIANHLDFHSQLSLVARIRFFMQR